MGGKVMMLFDLVVRLNRSEKWNNVYAKKRLNLIIR